jgi:hypothetical protein
MRTRLSRATSSWIESVRRNRKVLIALAGVLALVFAFVSSNVAANHEPKPHGLPVGVIGSPQVTAAAARRLELAEPGGFKVVAYRSSAAARTAILHRRVYGAYEPGPHPSLLVASAASSAAALVLRQTFQAAARARGQRLVVRDLAPLPRSDSSGATSFSATLSLIIAATLGSSVIYMVTHSRPLTVRLATVAALGVGAGLMTALATNVVVGAFPGHFLAVWGVAALFVLAMALPIAAFQVLLGLAGTGIGLVVFVVIGNPSSGGATAPELLPGFWRAISQLLPPGAGTTAMRDVVYFHGHGTTHALLVLSIYAILGAAGAIAASRLRAPASPATAPG